MKLVDRFGALCGGLSILLVTVGGDVLGTPPGPQVPHPSGQQDLEYLRWLADHPSAQVGVSFELLGFTLLILFIGYVSTRVRAAGWLAAAALAGGVIGVAIKLGSAAPMFAAYLLRDEISPPTARVLVDMNGGAFVMTWLPMGLFVACAAAGGVVTNLWGRPLGWFGVLAGSATVAAAAVTGVHVLSAFFVPYLLCMLWILIISLRLGLRRSTAGVTATPSSPVPVRA
jgi:hypothetical protein